MSRVKFEVHPAAQSGIEPTRARAGLLITRNARIETPVFMPVGTHATVRGQRLEGLERMGFPMLLANTYHLLLRPGPDLFHRVGGIRRFMAWQGGVLTDSGGFQIFSLPNARTLSEEGAEFTSYVDSRRVLLTPELSIAMQKALGSDIMMALDQCLPSTESHAAAREAVELTHRWARRSLAARGDSPQALFGIVQGACYPDLRGESARQLTELAFDGFAIGGLAVGETRAQREDMTELTAAQLPPDRPRYLMGVGTPLDILEAVHRGVDMFDCILPTSMAARGVAYTWNGLRRLRRGVYKSEDGPLDAECSCSVCARYSCAYLHHLIQVPECLGPQLIAEHNLWFYARLLQSIRASLLQGRFVDFYRKHRTRLDASDPEFPVTRPKRSRPRQPARRLPPYEVHELRPGVFSLRHLPSGEVMHSVNDPGEEARGLYLGQSRLLDRLRVADDSPLVVWDVGLGAAVNAMAVVQAVESAPLALRPVHLVSFENDLTALRLVLRHAPLFPHVRHAAPHALLERKEWESSRAPVRWSLQEGDFLERLGEAPPPDLIFFDPFSTRTDRDLWTLAAFRRIAERCADRATALITYSNATGVRGALLAAGFFVAKGVPTGPKEETTLALTRRAADEGGWPDLLSGEWLARWERSHARHPIGLAPEDVSSYEATVRRHPQFSRGHDASPPSTV